MNEHVQVARDRSMVPKFDGNCALWYSSTMAGVGLCVAVIMTVSLLLSLPSVRTIATKCWWST